MRDYSATLTKVFDKTRNTHNESPETKHSIKLIETIRTNSMVVTIEAPAIVGAEKKMSCLPIQIQQN